MAEPAVLDRPLEDVSPIATEVRRLQAYLADAVKHKERDEAVKAYAEKRNSLVTELKEAGLKVSEVNFNGKSVDQAEVVHDVSQHDDARKLVESLVRVPAITFEQIKKVYEIAEKHHLGVMTLGAKTSALGVFAAWDSAKMHGLHGIIAIEMPITNSYPKTRTNGKGETVEIVQPCNILDLPEIGEDEEIIKSDKHAIAVIRNKMTNHHRVIAHATTSVDLINRFLAEALGTKDHHYQILPDLTSKADAALGGVIATGAQGPNRTSARADMLSCMVVDALGKRVLRGEEAKDIVGYNGYFGTCVQVEFEVTGFPPHQFGCMIPVKAKDPKELWEHALEIQARLSPYCVHPKNLHKQPEGRQRTCITGIEIIGKDGLKKGIELTKDAGDDEMNTGPLEDLLATDTEMFIYVTGNTFDLAGDSDKTRITDILLRQPAFKDGLQTKDPGTPREGVSLEDYYAEKYEELFTPDGIYIKPREDHDDLFEGVFLLSDPKVLRGADIIRHGTAEIARKEGNKIGGQTQSTDFNIQFKGTPTEQVNARKKVAAIYAEYHQLFVDGPYRIDLYGHLFPGIVPDPVGGGMDPHIRISLNLSHPATRNDSPERVNKMKADLARLYKALLGLNGTDGIVVTPPEKSHLTNMEYVHWMRLHHPHKFKELWQKLLGPLSPQEREKFMLSAFRVPIEIPEESRRGMSSFFRDELVPSADRIEDLNAWTLAVAELSELTHRGPEVKGMFREVVTTLREHLGLHPYTQHPFFIESADEGKRLIERNLGTPSGYTVKEIHDPENIPELDSFDPNTFYLIPAEFLGGIPGLCVMITPLNAIQQADIRKQQGLNPEGFRDLPTLFRQYPYETPETPNIPAVAYLGLSLQKRMGELKDQKGRSHRKRVVTANPGPCQIDPYLKEVMKKEGFALSDTPEQQEKDIKAYREYHHLPAEMRLGMTGSSTQCMQHFGEALARKKDKVEVIQVVNDAFGSRLNGILSSHKIPVTTITTPWTTSEQSQSEYVTNKLEDIIRGKVAEKGKLPVLFLTPHKTSTTAHFHPKVIVEDLKRRNLILGKDYEIVCDITSGGGVIDYYDGSCDQGMSFFCSIQKGEMCPPGLGVYGLSEHLKTLLLSDEENNENPSALWKCVTDTEKGKVNNTFALRMLGERCRHQLEQEKTISNVQEETRRKMNTVIGFMQLHPDLCMQVPSSEDQSPLLIGIYSLTHNLGIATRLMEEIFGYYVGGGYGPYTNESIRLYLANMSAEELEKYLAALHVVLQKPEVTQTVNPDAPLVSLREPHDPLQVLKRLATNTISPDHLFKDRLGLDWIGRLIETLKAEGTESPYGAPENIVQIKRILSYQIQGKKSLYYLYKGDEGIGGGLVTIVNNLREMILKYEKSGNISLDDIQFQINKLRGVLFDIVLTLEKYVKESAPKKDGRPIWPIAASKIQIHAKGNGK